MPKPNEEEVLEEVKEDQDQDLPADEQEEQEPDYKTLYESEKEAKEAAIKQKEKWAGRYKNGKKKIETDFVSVDEVDEVVSESIRVGKIKDELGEEYKEVEKIMEEKDVSIEVAVDLHKFYLTQDEQYQAQQRSGALGLDGRSEARPPSGANPEVESVFKEAGQKLKAKYGDVE